MYVIKFVNTPTGFTNTMVDIHSEDIDDLLYMIKNTYDLAYNPSHVIGLQGCKIFRTHTGRPLYSIDSKFTFCVTEATFLKG